MRKAPAEARLTVRQPRRTNLGMHLRGCGAWVAPIVSDSNQRWTASCPRKFFTTHVVRRIEDNYPDGCAWKFTGDAYPMRSLTVTDVS
jgi:hypothetical protein